MTATRGRSTRAAKILIVEDESIVALHIAAEMRQHGYTVLATVATGEAALEKCDVLHPDLVLMDIRLQGEMNGIQAGRAIQDRFAIPVLYLTAYADQVESLLPHGRVKSRYLAKPFKESDLYEIVETLLHT
ncbi:MAG: response regulator [Anaerolineae bacterium]|nr:response regulator [Anaerolineae bacterium]